MVRRARGTVGITAGTSTPDPVIDGVDRRIRELAATRGARRRRRRGQAMTRASRERARWLVGRRVCHGNGVGRISQRVLPSLGGRSDRAVPGESPADAWSPGSGRARARGGDPRDAGLTVGMLAGRTWRARLGYTGGRVRRLGHFLLRVSANDVRLAAVAVRLGHPLSAAVAVVGAGAGARLLSRSLMIVWGTYVTQAPQLTQPAAHAGGVGLDRNRHRARPVCLHGRFNSTGPAGPECQRLGASDRIQLADLRDCASVDGRATGVAGVAAHGRQNLPVQQVGS